MFSSLRSVTTSILESLSSTSVKQSSSTPVPVELASVAIDIQPAPIMITVPTVVTVERKEEKKDDRITGPFDYKLLNQLISEVAPGSDKVSWHDDGIADIIIRREEQKAQQALGEGIKAKLEYCGIPVHELAINQELPPRFIEQITQGIFNESVTRGSVSDPTPDGEYTGPLELLSHVKKITGIVLYHLLNPTEVFFNDPVTIIKRELEEKEVKTVSGETIQLFEKAGLCWAQASQQVTDTFKASSTAELMTEANLNQVGRLMFVKKALHGYVAALKKNKPEWTATLDAAFAPQRATIIRANSLNQYNQKLFAEKDAIEVEPLSVDGRLVCNVTGLMTAKDSKKTEKALLIVTIDESGSMQQESRMSHALDALRTLVGRYRMDKEDTDFAVVAFGTHARVILPPQSVLHHSDLGVDKLAPVLAGNWPSYDNTNLTDGIELTLQLVKKATGYKFIHNVLLTDGEPTVGRFHDTSPIGLDAFRRWIETECKGINPHVFKATAFNVNPNDIKATWAIKAYTDTLNKLGCKAETKPIQAATISHQVLSIPFDSVQTLIPVYTQIASEKKEVAQIKSGKFAQLQIDVTQDQLDRGLQLFIGDRSYPVESKNIRVATRYEAIKIQEKAVDAFFAANGIIHGDKRSIENKQTQIEKEIVRLTTAGNAQFAVAKLKKYITPTLGTANKDYLAATGQVQFKRATAAVGSTVGGVRVSTSRYRKRPSASALAAAARAPEISCAEIDEQVRINLGGTPRAEVTASTASLVLQAPASVLLPPPRTVATGVAPTADPVSHARYGHHPKS